MRSKRLTFFLLLSAVLAFCNTCLAFSPTPTPRPTARDSCAFHIHLSVPGLSGEPKKHLLYSHEHGIMADGFLMFAPLADYAGREQIPTITRSQYRAAVLSADGYVEQLSAQTTLYKKTEDGLVRVEDNGPSLEELPGGVYLIKMDVNASHAGEAYRFYYLFWTE